MKHSLKSIVAVLAFSSQCIAQENVDTKIPVNDISDANTFVVIISNEHYRYEQPVPYAINDGEAFQLYCEKALGIPKKNIRYSSDATLNDMRVQLHWLNNIMSAYEGEARAIVYYSGHGMPDENGAHSYLLPVDGNSTMPYSGLSTADMYTQLGKMPSKSTMVFLDACFSGSRRDGQMLAMSRGVAIKARPEAVSGNVVVFSAAQGTETAYPYSEKQHGMFTYYILKLLQEKGGYVGLGELSDYVVKQVRRMSILDNNKEQTPSVVASASCQNWREWSFASAAATHYEVVDRYVEKKDEERAKAEQSSPLLPDAKIEGGKAPNVSPVKSKKQMVIEDFVSKFCALYGVELSRTKMSDIEDLFGVRQKKGKNHLEISLSDGTDFNDCHDNGVFNLLCINPEKTQKDFPHIGTLNWKSSYDEWNEWFVSQGFENQPYDPYFARQAMLVYRVGDISVILMFSGRKSSHGTWFSLIITNESDGK